MQKHEVDAEIERIIKKNVAKSLDLKLFGLRPENVEAIFDPYLPHNAEVTRGYPCKIIFGLGALKNLKYEINQILQFIQKNNMVEPMAIVKYKHIRNHEKKWNREFISSQTNGTFKLIPMAECEKIEQKITVIKHKETGVEVSHVGDNPNEWEMRTVLSKRVADFCNVKARKQESRKVLEIGKIEDE